MGHVGLNAALHSKELPFMALEVGPLNSSIPCESLWAHESFSRTMDVLGCCPGPSEPKGFPPNNLRAGNALQQLLHPGGFGIHTHLP